MLSALVLVALMFVAGAALARAGIFSDTDADTINRFVVYVSLPALVLSVVPRLQWEAGLALLVIVPWATLALGVACVLLAARLCGWSREVTGALLLCATLGNTSFLGVPLIAALRGQAAVRYALIYDQFGSFLILSTYGLIVLARYSGERPPSAGQLALRLIKFPPFVALLLALLPWPPLPLLEQVLARVGDTLAPLAMFAVGMRLRLRAPSERSALWLGLAIKMLILPLSAFALTRALGRRELYAEVAVLESAMPPMLTAAALASMAGLAPELCAALAAYGIALAFLTLPAWAALF
jgi:malate permease and related proteins